MLDKKERMKIVYQISDILDNHCRGCEYNTFKKGRNNIDYCTSNCEHGIKLKKLGDILDPNKEKNIPGKKPKKKEVVEVANITQKAYESMKNEGKSDSFIANHFGVKQPTLAYHKKKWYGEQDKVKQVVSKPKQIGTPVISTPVIKDTSDTETLKLKHENDSLKAKLTQLESTYKALQADYEDLKIKHGSMDVKLVNAESLVQHYKEAADANIKAWHVRVDELESEITKWKAEVENVNKRNLDLENLLNALKPFLTIKL